MCLFDVVVGLAAGFFEEADAGDLHGGVDGFEHVDDGEGGDGDGGEGFHFDAGFGGDGSGAEDAERDECTVRENRPP